MPQLNEPLLRKRCSKLRSNLLQRTGSSPTQMELVAWFTKQYPWIDYYTLLPVKLEDIQVDHKVPVSRGGSSELSNMAVVSKGTNQAKGNMTDEEFLSLLALLEGWEDKGKSILTRLKQGRFG